MTTEISVEEIANWFDYPNAVSSDLENANIVYACYETGCYEGDWCVIFVKDGRWFVDSGGHCSCNGPEWSPSETSLEQLLSRYSGNDSGAEREAREAVEAFARVSS